MDIRQTCEWLQLYESNKINAEDLARELNISKRQAYRVIKRYKEEGIRGLLHKGRNKQSNHHIAPAKKEEILRLIKEKYYDCGASFASDWQSLQKP